VTVKGLRVLFEKLSKQTKNSIISLNLEGTKIDDTFYEIIE